MKYIAAFEYPKSPHDRRHRPIGYTDCESYRDWLRDDFEFRCVFCLRRENWLPRRSSFHIDHLIPQSQAPDRAWDYTNLAYVCASCNSVKSDIAVPNPCDVGFGRCAVVRPNGEIDPLNRTGAILIDVMRLDDDDSIRFRRMILESLRSIVDNGEHDLYVRWMGYPEDLPDLSLKRPPENLRPEGIDESCFARKQRGELSETY